MVLKKTVMVIGALLMLWVLLSWINVLFAGTEGTLWNGNMFLLIVDNF